MSNENRFDAYKNHAKNSDRLRANRVEATVRYDEIAGRKRITSNTPIAFRLNCVKLGKKTKY